MLSSDDAGKGEGKPRHDDERLLNPETFCHFQGDDFEAYFFPATGSNGCVFAVVMPGGNDGAYSLQVPIDRAMIPDLIVGLYSGSAGTWDYFHSESTCTFSEVQQLLSEFEQHRKTQVAEQN